MKLLRARIQNFRLLRDIALEFGAGQAKSLTVIRAANDSGKTTLLTALQWGLFGDLALQDSGRDYRLSPLDISSGPSVTADVSVELDWETQTQTGKRKYRILRPRKRDGARQGMGAKQHKSQLVPTDAKWCEQARQSGSPYPAAPAQ